MGTELFYISNFLLEALSLWFYSDRIFLKKRSFGATLVGVFGGYFLLYCVSLLQQPFINILAFLIVNFFLLAFYYSTNIRQIFTHSIFLTSAMVLCEMFWLWGIDDLGVLLVNQPNHFSKQFIVAVYSKVLYLLVVLVCSFLLKSQSPPHQNYRTSIILMILPALSIVVSYIASNIGFSAPESAPVKNLLLLVMFVIAVVNILFILLYYKLQKINNQQLQLQLSLQQEQANLTYYQALHTQSENQRVFIHDIRNHLQCIYAIAELSHDYPILQYVETIVSDINKCQLVRLCSDPILNIILLNTQDQCQTKDIDFHCDVRQNCSFSEDAPSITTLYGNLLSNAVEAAQCSEEKYIELSVTKHPQQEQVIISVINSCDKAPISDGKGGFISQKVDKNIHGLGMKSIRRIVKKYNGQSMAYYDAEQHLFHHILQFPI